MAFKLTYSDGQETEYGDDTSWDVDDGVLKMGREEGKWTVLVSPSHWAVIEVGTEVSKDGDENGEHDDKSADRDSKGEPDADDPAKGGDEKSDDK